MLKKILSVSGRSGLFKLISYGKNMLLVESMLDGKRFPIHARENVMSLGDISMYTTSEDVPLVQVLENVGKKFENKPVDANEYSTPDKLREFMGMVLENFDTERVHNSDIKKVIAWYNILINCGITDFTAKADEKKADDAEAEEKKD